MDVSANFCHVDASRGTRAPSMPLHQARTAQEVERAAKDYGVPPGGRALLRREAQAASEAIASGVYITWRSSDREDCARVSSKSRCFCGHTLEQHSALRKGPAAPPCKCCDCPRFEYVPERPEAVGMWWLPRRKGFNVHEWRAPCKCKHGHDAHDPRTRRCTRCGCGHFTSDYACICCNRPQEEHETHFETAQERAALGLPVGEAFMPLRDCSAALQQQVFGGGIGSSACVSEERTPEARIARGEIGADEYHRLISATAGASICCTSCGAPGSATRERAACAPPSIVAAPIRGADGKARVVLHNLAPPEPRAGHDWSRQWEPAAAQRAHRVRGPAGPGDARPEASGTGRTPSSGAGSSYRRTARGGLRLEA